MRARLDRACRRPHRCAHRFRHPRRAGVARRPRANLADLSDETSAIARLPDGRLLPMPMTRVRALLGVLIELYREKPLDEHGRLKLSRAQAAPLGDIEGTGGQLAWSGGERLA